MITFNITKVKCKYGCETSYLYCHEKMFYCYAHWLAKRQDGQLRVDAYKEEYNF